MTPIAIELKMLIASVFLYVGLIYLHTATKFQAYGVAFMTSARDGIDPSALSQFGARAERAFANYQENFIPFAVAVLLAANLEAFTLGTSVAAVTFLVSRLVHPIVYLAGITPLRTVAYTVGLIATLYIYLVILGIMNY